MAKCELTIHLDDENATFRGGDTVTGSVEVRTDGDVRCDGLTLECRWETHGKGNRVHGENPGIQLFVGEWAGAGTHRYPFSFQLPHGPFTYHGRYLNVGWFLRARADVPWALDPKAEREIPLAPNPDEEPRWTEAVATAELLPGDLRTAVAGEQKGPQPPAGARHLGNVVAIGCLAVVAIPLLALVAAAVFQGIALVRGEADPMEALLMIGMAGIFVLLFLGGAAKVVSNRMARKRLGDVTFEVSPLTLRPGERLRARLQCRPQKTSELNGATLRIAAEEVVTRGSGTSRSTYRHTVHEREVEVPIHQGLSAGLPFHLDHELEIPADAAPSFMARDNRLTWTVSLRLDIPRWPDWTGERAIVVHP